MNPLDYVSALEQIQPPGGVDLVDYNHRLRSKLVRSLDFAMEEASRCEREHGFTEATPGEDIALMHSELSEAFEEMRAGHKPSELYYNVDSEKPLKPEGVPAELADVLIRIVGFCKRHHIDLAEAVVRKMLYNETRPYKHGGKTL